MTSLRPSGPANGCALANDGPARFTACGGIVGRANHHSRSFGLNVHSAANETGQYSEQSHGWLSSLQVATSNDIAVFG